MPAFTFTARDSAGNRQNGSMDGTSATAVAAELRGRGWLVLGVEENVETNLDEGFHPLGWLPVRSIDVEFSLHQLATLLRSGVTLLAALRLIAEQSERRRMRHVWREVIDSVESGHAMGESLALHQCFHRLVVQLVAVGEQTGNLSQVLERAATSLEKRRELRNNLITAITYPGIVFFMSLGVAAFMVISVIPKLRVFLQAIGKKLPPMTQRLVDIGDWLNMNGTVAAITAVTVIAAVVACYLWPPGRQAADRLLVRMPLFGTLFRTAGTALFSKSFSVLIASGVTIIEALRVTERLLTNHYLREVVSTARERVLQGEPLAPQLNRPQSFMPLLPRMVAVGENSGTLDDVLAEVARFYEGQLERMIRRMSNLIEPVTIVLVGCIVGYVYISFFVAMFAATGSGNNLH